MDRRGRGIKGWEESWMIIERILLFRVWWRFLLLVGLSEKKKMIGEG
jgi:hypothetical protein